MKESSEKRHNEVNSNFNKLEEQNNELKSEIHEQKLKCEGNFNELKKQNNELKNDINEINKRLENTNEIFTSNVNKLERNIERMGEWRADIGKCKTSENNGDIAAVSYTHLDVYKRQLMPLLVPGLVQVTPPTLFKTFYDPPQRLTLETP